jgi:hypothetical protein
MLCYVIATLTDRNTQFSAAPCRAIVLREYTAGRYRAFCLCLCAEFKLTKCKRKQLNFLILKPRGLLCVRATGERTLFSIKTKSGALHVHRHADGCTHRLKTYSETYSKRNQKTLFFAYFSTRSLTRNKFCFENRRTDPAPICIQNGEGSAAPPRYVSRFDFKHFDLFYQDRLWTAASSALTQLHFCTGQVFASASQVRSI